MGSGQGRTISRFGVVARDVGTLFLVAIINALTSKCYWVWRRIEKMRPHWDHMEVGRGGREECHAAPGTDHRFAIWRKGSEHRAFVRRVHVDLLTMSQ